MRAARWAVLIVVAAASLVACSGSTHPKAHVVANPNGTPPATVTQAMYARVKPNQDAIAINTFVDTKIEVDPASDGLYYRVPERLVAIYLRPGSTKAQIDALKARLEATGWFSKIVIGGPTKVPDSLFDSGSNA
jgi:hypothetical protein